MHFKNPPITELAIGVYFDRPLLKMRAEHIGLFWAQIHKKFPRAEQRVPIVPQTGGAVEIPAAPDEMVPLPRFWFVSSDDSKLIQLQRTALLLNWRRRDNAYPRYDTLKAEFDTIYALFASFLEDTAKQEFAIEATELTYVNLIEAGPNWTGVNDIPSVLPGFAFPPLNLPNAVARDVSQTSVWSLDDNHQMIVKVQTVEVNASKQPGLLVELNSKAQLGAATKSEADAWFERAHEYTLQTFKNVTSAKLQNEVWIPEA